MPIPRPALGLLKGSFGGTQVREAAYGGKRVEFVGRIPAQNFAPGFSSGHRLRVWGNVWVYVWGMTWADP